MLDSHHHIIVDDDGGNVESSSNISIGECNIETAIRQCLDHYLLDDAVFLAQLYFDQSKSDAALYLLSTCHYRLGQVKTAYNLLNVHGYRTPQMRYFFAKCCFELNKLPEAEQVLVTDDAGVDDDDQDALIDRNFAESAPFARALLSRIYCKTNRIKSALVESKSALRQNPLLWSTLRSACDMCTDDVQLDSISTIYARYRRTTYATDQCETSIIVDNKSTPSLNKHPDDTLPEVLHHLRDTRSTPSPFGIQLNAGGGVQAPLAPRKSKAPKPVTTTTTTSKKSGQSSMKVNSSVGCAGTLQIRRSSRRIAHDSENVSQDDRRIRTGGRSDKQLRSNNRINQMDMQMEKDISTLNVINELAAEAAKQQQSLSESSMIAAKDVHGSATPITGTTLTLSSRPTFTAYDQLLDTLSQLSQVLMALTRYDSRTAIQQIGELTDELRRSPIVLVLLARAHFEANDYRRAVAIFEMCRRNHEHYLDGVELYSTALWHLQRETELSSLAQELTLNYRFAPQTWCVAGNCFSLQKEHDTAIKFFERAIQIDPDFTYAYSLLGHELIQTEEYNRSAQCFRAALLRQPNDYKAWYGLGTIHYKQEQLANARIYYMRALKVNARNSVLMCQLSIVEQALGSPDAAMRLLDMSLVCAPHNAACRYHRAYLLFARERHDEALAELNKLKLIAPLEAQVFFLAGKVYKKLNQTHLALLNFSWAAEMDPRGEQNHPTIGDRRYDEEPVLAAIDADAVDASAMDSDASV